MPDLDPASLAATIDHTLLAPEADQDAIGALCRTAIDLGTRTVCVNGRWVAHAAALVDGTDVGVCCVIDFPLGSGSTDAAVGEARAALDDGAHELDIVLPFGALLGGDDAAVRGHLATVRAATEGTVLKVIVESAVLDEPGLRNACSIVEQAGADFVKTSTGFHAAGGATVDAVRIMHEEVGGRLGIKASGGIRTLETAQAMLDAGATRLGMSASAAVVAELADLHG